MGWGGCIKHIMYATLISITLILGAQLFVDVLQFRSFIVSSLFFFVVLTIGIFWLGKMALKTPNKQFFINVVIVNVLLKMVLIFAFVFIYAKISNPISNKLFIAPFLICYLVFTVFETIILHKIAYK